MNDITTPGEYITDQMQMMNLGVSDVAKALNQPNNFVLDVINNKSELTYAQSAILQRLFCMEDNLGIILSKLSNKRKK